MSTLAKIGLKNPAAVIRDVSEKLPELRTVVVVGIWADNSSSVWASDTPREIERASVILSRIAMEEQGRGK